MSLPKRSAPYWSDPPFLIFWHTGTLPLSQSWAQECQYVKKIEKGGLDQYGPEHFEV